MDNKELLNYCMDYLSQKGVDNSQCVLSTDTMYELSSENDRISLLRNTISKKINIKAIIDKKKGTISANDLSKEGLDKALDDVVISAKASKKDDDYSISIEQEKKSFTRGLKKPDLDMMFCKLDKLIKDIKEKYPLISLRSVLVKFTQKDLLLMNTNNNVLESSRSYYTANLTFMAKEGNKISSFNYTGASFENLPDDILNYGNFDTILNQTTQLLSPKTVPDKFMGKVIYTPECLSDFIHKLTSIGLTDGVVYTKTSKLHDKLNCKVASEEFSLHSCPSSKDLGLGYFITSDGYISEDMTVIDKGVLKEFLLTDYGAKKANLNRSKNYGGCFIVDNGNTSLDNLIKNIDRGLLVARFSGGAPAANGDFSGIAKNSFYIEDGKIKHAVNETMISGNIYEMLLSIVGISKERVNSGSTIYPWICFNNVTVSGK